MTTAKTLGVSAMWTPSWMKRQRAADRAFHTWAEVTKRSEAMEEVIAVIGQFLETDSDISPEVAIFAIIGAIETRTGHRFLEPDPEGAMGVRTSEEQKAIRRRHVRFPLHSAGLWALLGVGIWTPSV